MKSYIDFSIFVFSKGAYGNVTGDIDLPSIPKIGDMVQLFEDDAHLEFPGQLRVTSITSVPANGPDDVVIGLEDVVVNSMDMAKDLATKLENECGLFFVEYDH